MRKYILIISLVLSGFLAAQDADQPKIDELHTRKWNFIVEKARLTPQEAARIKPLFMQYEESVWKIMESNKDFFREFYQNKENRGEAEYLEMNERFINAEIQKTHLLKNYYSKLKKQLSSESIFKYFNAERSFRKELIGKWQGRPGNPRR